MIAAVRTLALGLFAIAMVPVWIVVTVALVATLAVEYFVVNFIHRKEPAA